MMRRDPVCHILFVWSACVCVWVNGGGLYLPDVIGCDWTAVTESGEQAFPTMHMRTEGGTHELIAAARATRRQTWLLLQSCASKLTQRAHAHTRTGTHDGLLLIGLINKAKGGD